MSLTQPKANSAHELLDRMENDLHELGRLVAALQVMAEGFHAMRELQASRAVRGIADGLERALDDAKTKREQAWEMLGRSAS